MSEQVGSKVVSKESQVQKGDIMQTALAARIAALKKADPVAYTGLTVKETYSLNEAVALTGYSRVWLHRQIKAGKLQAKLIAVQLGEGNPIQAWRISAESIVMLIARKEARISGQQTVFADPKSHYTREPKSLLDQVKSATPAEKEELKKLLGL